MELIRARHLPRRGGVTSERHCRRQADGNIFFPGGFATALRKIFVYYERIAFPPKTHRKHRRDGGMQTLSWAGRREELLLETEDLY